MKYKIILLVVAVFSQTGSTLDLTSFGKTAQDVAKVGANVAKGVIEKVPDLIPTPNQIFDLSKQAIAGLPVEVVAAAINQVCSIALTSNATESDRSVKINEMNYVLLTPTENVSIPILNSLELWNHTLFNADFNVVILVTGWTSDINDTNKAIDLIYEGYSTRGNTNFVVVDTAGFVDTLYTWSAFNTNELGESIGVGLSQLVDYVSVDKIHLIGHSLGAHIVGAAGRKFQLLTNQSLPRITGLDPANPCFNEGEALSGIMRGDADFVDVIHSNSKVLGKRDPIGDIDFYPNGVVSVQPGCWSITCSHARAWKYYAESVHPGNENNFLAKKCNSLKSLDIGACQTKEIPMGYACPTDIKGNFFLRTNSEKPYGRKDNFKAD
uniref:Putative vitellogenin n=1 Tax=Corethrella appendiculata TaxID=1370023 RepID=U5EEG1_9DIPT